MGTWTGLTRNPEHGGEGDHEAKKLPPDWILVVAHRDGYILHKVEREQELQRSNQTLLIQRDLIETHHHECWSKEDPADKPVVVHPVSHHVLDANIEPAHRQCYSPPKLN